MYKRSFSETRRTELLIFITPKIIADVAIRSFSFYRSHCHRALQFAVTIAPTLFLAERAMKFLGNVFLVGPMGVGKTTIGKVLAEQLDLQFFDSDREIETSTGADIPWIFDVEGESGFRARESKMIDQLSGKSNIVLATGGGAVLAEENRKYLSERGTVVYLQASIAQQAERTSKDKNRPLLKTDDPEKKIRELMELREPLYREIADIVIDTNKRNARSVSQEINKILQEQSE